MHCKEVFGINDQPIQSYLIWLWPGQASSGAGFARLGHKYLRVVGAKRGIANIVAAQLAVICIKSKFYEVAS